MAKRYKFRQDIRKYRDKPENVEYDRVKDAFKDFPAKKRYRQTKAGVPTKIKPESVETRPKEAYKARKVRRRKEREFISSEQRFDKAFVISLGLIALLSILIFIPLIGPLLALTLTPYLACNFGCRYVNKRNGMQVGLLIAIIWSMVEIYLLFQFLTFIKISLTSPGIGTPVDAAIIVLIIIANLIFCLLGGYTGGAKYDKQITKPETKAIVDA